MTYTKAIQAAEKGVYAWDERYRAEVRDTHNHVRVLYRMGFSASEISTRVGLCRRQVERVKTLPEPVQPPQTPVRVSDVQADGMLAAADAAVDLACRLRDENPAIVWNALWRMDRVSLQKLTVAALAGLNPDVPVSELFGWVLNLPVAQEAA